MPAFRQTRSKWGRASPSWNGPKSFVIPILAFEAVRADFWMDKVLSVCLLFRIFVFATASALQISLVWTLCIPSSS